LEIVGHKFKGRIIMKTRYFTLYLVILIALVLTLSTANPTNALSNRAYIPNWDSKNVSVIDISTNTVINTISVGNNPRAVAVSEIKKRVYVANYSDRTISVIDTDAQMEIDTIPVDNPPNWIAINPTGTRLYVVYDRINGASLAVIDTANNATLKKMDVGGPWPMAVDFNYDGTRAYAVNRFEEAGQFGTVRVIDTATDTQIDSITIPGWDAFNIAINRAGTKAYVITGTDGNLHTIDLANNIVTNSLHIGNMPWGIAINSTGTLVYAVDRRKDFTSPIMNGNVVVVDTASNAIIHVIEVGQIPFGIALSPDDSKAYIANTWDDNVSVLNTATNTIVSTIPVGGQPWAFGRFIDTTSHVSVGIDIKPTSINLRKTSQISVVIFSTMDFDAVNQISHESLTFGRTGSEDSLAYCINKPKDLNRDKIKDLLCYFYADHTGFQCGDNLGILNGYTVEGFPVIGSESVKILPCK
jgi:YVTN family beta-propeller protein